MPHTARHARPALHSALLLPGVLLVVGSSALAGLAVLPGSASAVGAAPTPPSEVVVAHAGLRAAPDARTAAAQAVELAPDRLDERASRDRRPAPAPAPAVAAPAPPPPPPQFVRPGTGRLTSGYGTRWGRLHAGIDLAAGVGAPISAVAAGTVTSATSEGGYGRVVRLQHDDGTLTLYAHLSELLVQTGQRVTAGTYIGREGNSGRSTGPHLHFEVRIDGVPVDPEPWLRARGVDPTAH